VPDGRQASGFMIGFELVRMDDTAEERLGRFLKEVEK
jgi:hypothetical protein